MECMRTPFTRHLGPPCHYSEHNHFKRRISSIPCYKSTNASCRLNLTTVVYLMHPVNLKNKDCRAFAASVDLEEEEEHSSNLPEGPTDDASGRTISRKLTQDELKALLADSERLKLTKKLSEANQHNRFLKRQLQTKDDALVDFKSQLAVLELELQALVSLAEEVVSSGIPPDSKQINGNYVQAHLLSRLQAMHEKIKEQIVDVDSFKFQDVTVTWVGMAESVQVMGSFDGWSHGEELSPEYAGDYTKFSTTLKLRPGRYEIKFLVDGEWQLSPEFPTTGEGLLENNLLIVE
ncbi:PROTEIN TARGETING TO STARCH (PTST) [Rhynchospora pubera]|uniref:PROTEIN TARGETING TO STARCH (PTST) n=1 Tax=Rhynchospora pubera TaxID=906938 RepID=A0AAV8G2K6_9POAL|nr:PROTEIN TARGETING TO STARCH (PTST) [Rhynchospora pubera]